MKSNSGMLLSKFLLKVLKVDGTDGMYAAKHRNRDLEHHY